MKPKYVFEFETDNAIVGMDVYENHKKEIQHSLRFVIEINTMVSDEEKRNSRKSKPYAAYLYYPDIAFPEKHIAAVEGFDFSICTEEQLDLFLRKLLYRAEESTRYKIGTIKEFAEFADLME